MGGAERSLLELISIIRIARPEWEVDVLLGDKGPLQLAIAQLGIPVSIYEFPEGLKGAGDSGFRGPGKWLFKLYSFIQLPFRLYQIWLYKNFLKRFIKQKNSLVVHSNGYKYHLITGLFKLPGIKLVWHVRDYVTTRAIAKLCIQWFCSKPDVVVANSHSVSDDWQKVLPQAHCRVLYNTVDTRVYGLCTNRQRLPHSGNSSQAAGHLFVGLVASFARWKGQLLFIDAIRLLQKTGNCFGVSFFIVGGPIYTTKSSQYSLQELEDYVNILGLNGTVHFMPHQNDMPAIYQAFDIVVHASTEPEPFGRTIVEAMACGVPVVAAMDGGVLEIVQDGINGLGFKPGDVNDLAAKISLLLTNQGLRLRLGKAGRKSVQDCFSRDALSGQLIDFYECLVGITS